MDDTIGKIKEKVKEKEN